MDILAADQVLDIGIGKGHPSVSRCSAVRAMKAHYHVLGQAIEDRRHQPVVEIDMHVVVERRLIAEGRDAVEEVRVLVGLKQLIDHRIGLMLEDQPLSSTWSAMKSSRRSGFTSRRAIKLRAVVMRFLPKVPLTSLSRRRNFWIFDVDIGQAVTKRTWRGSLKLASLPLQ